MVFYALDRWDVFCYFPLCVNEKTKGTDTQAAGYQDRNSRSLTPDLSEHTALAVDFLPLDDFWAENKFQK